MREYKARSSLTFKERVPNLKKLEEVIVPGEGDLCSYSPGWDDEAVARALGVAKNNVAGVRREMFGGLRDDTRGDPKPDLEARIAELERRLTIVERRLI